MARADRDGEAPVPKGRPPVPGQGRPAPPGARADRTRRETPAAEDPLRDAARPFGRLAQSTQARAAPPSCTETARCPQSGVGC